MFGINQTEQNLTKKKTIKTSMLMRQWQTLNNSFITILL